MAEHRKLTRKLRVIHREPNHPIIKLIASLASPVSRTILPRLCKFSFTTSGDLSNRTNATRISPTAKAMIMLIAAEKQTLSLRNVPAFPTVHLIN